MNIFKDFIEYLTKLFTWWVVIMPWQQGVRVTLGKKTEILSCGIWLKLPLIHVVYVQEKRMRIISLPMQTVSTKDGQTITLSCSIGYTIEDIAKLFNTLYQPDTSIQNMVQSLVAKYIATHDLNECSPILIENSVSEQFKIESYGLKVEGGVKIIGFAIVRTYRLIQDHTQMWEGLDLRGI